MPKKESKLQNYFSTGITMILVLLAVVSVIGVWHQKKNGELFYLFRHRPVIILSGSMEPELKTGTVTLVRKTKDIKQGDVIFFFTEEGTPVIHRFHATDENGNIITKGDANKKEDLKPVCLKNVEGKVVLHMNWLSPVVTLLSGKI